MSGRSKEMQKAADGFSEAAFGRKQGRGVCVTCGSEKIGVGDFRDYLSKKEFGISGMCQSCQDGVFGK